MTMLDAEKTTNAKVISMDVRPLQASYLCFEIGGIVGELTTTLGAQAPAFDFPGFYAVLGTRPTVPGDPSRLLYDFLEIQAFTNPLGLASLRAEPAKAILNQAINSRQNAYFAKYANAAGVIAQMNAFYSPSAVGSKPRRLENLRSLAADQAYELRAAYANDSRTGVVKQTTSQLTSHIDSNGSSTTLGQSNEELIRATSGPGWDTIFRGPPPGGEEYPPGTKVLGTISTEGELEEGTSGQRSSSWGHADESQTIVNTDYAYRTPFFDSQAQYERAQISLIDEQFAEFMAGQDLPHLAQVFANELQSIDGDVFRLQVSYLNTILLSPIPGTVTGIYKNPGDPVRAGEPVVRVENDAEVLVVARLVYRGRISIGSTATIETTLFDAPGPATSVTGKVVAARGQGDDDEWEVIVQCGNRTAAGEVIFPFGYHFDYDDTTVSIS